LTTIDVPAPDIIINQTSFLLALLISVGAVAGLGVQFIRWINKRIRKARDEEAAKIEQTLAELRRDIEDRFRDFNESYNAQAKLIQQKQEFHDKIIDYIMQDVDRLEDNISSG
jgi:uncharacterized protein involved in exopolysaccharide biosynthesis